MTTELDPVLAWLDSRRRHVVGTLDGLDETQRRRAVLPSGWSLVGLVQHLTLDVERFWFRAVVAGEDVVLPHGNEGWTVADDLTSEDVIARYTEEWALADRALRGADPGAAPRWWPEGSCPYGTVQEIAMHVLVETSIHAGHADAARELLDGSQRLVLT